MKKINLSFLFIVVTGIMWAVDGVFFTPRYFEYNLYDTKYIVFITHLIPTLILTFIIPKTVVKIFKTFTLKDYLSYFAISLVGGAFGTLSIVKALQLVNFQFSIVAIIQQLQPLFATLFSFIILKEKIGKKFVIVLTTSMIATYVLKFGLVLPDNISSIEPIIYSLIASICYGASTVLSRKVSLTHDFIESVYARYFTTTIIMIFILIITRDINSIYEYTVNKNIFINTLIISIWGILSLLFYFKGMKSTSALSATLAELSYPFTAVILNILIYKVNFTTIQIIATIVLVTSIVYYNLTQPKI